MEATLSISWKVGSSHSGTVLYETNEAGQKNLNVYETVQVALLVTQFVIFLDACVNTWHRGMERQA